MIRAPESAHSVTPPGALRASVEALGTAVMVAVEDLGGITTLAVRSLFSFFFPPYRLAILFGHLDFIGVGSIFLVSLTGLFTGMVFAKQSVAAFALFNAQSLVGPTVILSITRELAPVFTALMVTMRAGSAIATELGTMRVTEQIDALVTLAVDPVKYLIVPRIVAGFLMTPVLCMLFDAAGVGGAYIVAVFVEDQSAGTFLFKTQALVGPEDLLEGVVKSAVFGLLITLIACYKGFTVSGSGGAKGVGKATTDAMVLTAVAIFVFDYFMDVLWIALV
jgi:phospholipid/cholesterol/gamma-HCH transport system permease protein